jgi:hypothetical protein
MVLMNTSVNIEESDLSALKVLKKNTGATISAQIQIAIREYLESRKKMGLLDEGGKREAKKK